jgi:hypothetical protein
MSPPAGAHRQPHGSEAHPLPRVLVPGSDAIDQAPIWIRHQVLSQPVQIDLSWAIPASRLVLHIARFTVPP